MINRTEVANATVLNDERLAETLVVPGLSRGILFIHGYLSDRSGYQEYALAAAEEAHATSLTFDLYGHGEKAGDIQNVTINDHLRQVDKAYDYLANQRTVSPKRIGVVGASYGGYLAVMLSANRPVKSLLLRAPALYPDGLEDVPRKDFDTDEIDAYRLREEPDLSSRNLQAVADFRGKITVVRSELDESIPEDVIQAYTKASPHHVEEKVIKGANHSLKGHEREIFKDMVADWAKEL